MAVSLSLSLLLLLLLAVYHFQRRARVRANEGARMLRRREPENGKWQTKSRIEESEPVPWSGFNHFSCYSQDRRSCLIPIFFKWGAFEGVFCSFLAAQRLFFSSPDSQSQSQSESQFQSQSISRTSQERHELRDCRSSRRSWMDVKFIFPLISRLVVLVTTFATNNFCCVLFH